MAIMLGISPKNPYVLLKYLVCVNSHLQRQVMLFKPNTTDEVYVQEQHLENIGHKKGQPSGSKQKENQYISREGKKWKEKDKKTTSMSH